LHAWRSLRRAILTPSITETKLEKRGFHIKEAAAQELLETIGSVFLAGYAYAVEARAPAAAEERLEKVPLRFRGFAYEGAAMGFAMLRALPFGGGRNLAGFLAGQGDRHIYMAYAGMGWAMARIPRFRWSAIPATDPLLRWLLLDGYGFHQAYFHTKRYVHGQFQDSRFGWPADGPRAYSARAIDQGIGRALWFIGGTDVEHVTTLIGKFPARRRSDLYSGIGLAATYAGGVGEAELRALVKRAGDHRAQLAQGSAFAAEARVRSGLVVPHTRLATQVLCGTTPEEAAQVTHDARPNQQDRGDEPAYEVWRQRIAEAFVSIGRVGT
jgi:enediyne biosynthesis protein E3